jgi:hypothetical protein
VRYLVVLVLGILLLLVPSPPSRADDGAIEAVGGAVSPLIEHATIRLSAEYVHIWFRPDGIQVECIFFLDNNGPATTVTMGFPNFSSGADVEANVPFSSFASYVDGDSVTVTIVPDAVRNHYGSYGCWYTKDVSFDAGQRRCVRDVYSGSTGHSVPDHRWFEYILWSGATWSGTIGVADVVVTFDSLSTPIDSLTVKPDGYHTSPNELRWHFTDLEPERQSEIGKIEVSWHGGRLP